jgi:hypothetical protein
VLPSAPTTDPTSPPYDAADYARDMADSLALTRSVNPKEVIVGTSATIYTIGLGKAVVSPPDYSGEVLLRYIASVGDDGDRTTDPCTQPAPADHKISCGNYYYAPQGGALRTIFEDIAKRIFTRLTR